MLPADDFLNHNCAGSSSSRSWNRAGSSTTSRTACWSSCSPCTACWLPTQSLYATSSSCSIMWSQPPPFHWSCPYLCSYGPCSPSHDPPRSSGWRLSSTQRYAEKTYMDAAVNCGHLMSNAGVNGDFSRVIFQYPYVLLFCWWLGDGGGKVPVPVWLLPMEQCLWNDAERGQALLHAPHLGPGEDGQLHSIRPTAATSAVLPQGLADGE